MTERAFPYRPKPLTMGLACAFFAVCTPVMAQIALGNDRGLIIDGLIRLDVGQATIFFWGLFGGSVILTLGGLWGCIKGLTSRHQLILADHALRVPKSGLSDKIVTVAYGDITGVSRFEMRNQQFLTVRFGKRKVDIMAGMLPNPTDFDEVCQTLTRRVQEARAAAQR